MSVKTNRANAQLSTGPRTPAGKQRSSLNALRHGLTGQIVVMPTEDLEANLLTLAAAREADPYAGAPDQAMATASRASSNAPPPRKPGR
jgi:hypothetical protein